MMEMKMMSILLLSSILLCCGNAAVPPATLKDQTYNFPQAQLPSTPGILPRYNVPLQPGAQNLVDLTFGTNVEGATITSVDQLGNVAYFYDLFGDPSNTRSAPVDGIPGNFKGIYSFYNEFLPNGTRNPLAVHQVLEDRLRLVARTAMPASEPGAQYEIGYIRLPFQFMPGMMAELTLSPGGWPTCRWSWPTFWAFSGVMLQGPPGNVTRWYGVPSLENDGFDGYPLDNTSQAISIAQGAPIYGNASLYGNPDDLYLQSTGDWRFMWNGGGGAGENRVITNSKNIPINPNNPALTVCMDWTDINTIKWIYNGEVVRIRHVTYPATYSTKYWDGAPPPNDLLGKTVPMFIMVSHQFAPLFNPIDLAALAADKGPIYAAYDIQSLRIWNKPSALEPPSSTPSTGPLPPPQSGPSLGDLPQLSSGTYIINVEAVNGNMVDHFGNSVTLVGDTQLAAQFTINGRMAAIMQTNGGISVTGPGIQYAQGGVSFVILQAMVNRNPYIGSYGTYAQFVQAYPANDWEVNKATLAMQPSKSFVAQLNFMGSSGSGNSSATTTSQTQLNQAELVTLTQQVCSDGTVTVGVGFGNKNVINPAQGGGVHASLLTGYTEFIIGSGRNRYGQIEYGANVLHGQTIVVATPKGLSTQDAQLLQAYFVKKWAVNNVNISSSSFSPSSSSFSPSASSFSPSASSHSQARHAAKLN